MGRALRVHALSVTLVAALAACRKAEPENIEAKIQASSASASPAAVASIDPSDASRAPSPPGAASTVYRGDLDARLPIVMRLESSGASVRGSYFYVKQGEDIALRGSLEADGTLHLDERVNGKNTGSFTLRPGNAGSLEGTWSAPGGAQQLHAKVDPIARGGAKPSIFDKHASGTIREVDSDGTKVTCKVDSHYPELAGLANAEAEQKINDALKAAVLLPTECIHAETAKQTCEVLGSSHDVFSIWRTWLAELPGSARGRYFTDRVITWDLRTGEEVSLETELTPSGVALLREALKQPIAKAIPDDVAAAGRGELTSRLLDLFAPTARFGADDKDNLVFIAPDMSPEFPIDLRVLVPLGPVRSGLRAGSVLARWRP
jgi:hypothetical protein